MNVSGVGEISDPQRRYRRGRARLGIKLTGADMAGCLQSVRTMRRRVTRPTGATTAQSGALPEIRLQGESVVFYLDIATGRGTSRLLLRCDADGNVWASVDDAATRDRQRDAA